MSLYVALALTLLACIVIACIGLFKCNHMHISWPFRNWKAGRKNENYVVCFDCGHEFEYDFTTMEIGARCDRNSNIPAISRVIWLARVMEPSQDAKGQEDSGTRQQAAAI